MKKFLYCAAVVALATTACTQDDFSESSSQAQTGQGLTFDVTLADNNVVTRGELYEDNGTYPFFWYAEQDRINVIGANLKAADGSEGYGSNANNLGVATQSSGTWTLTNGFAEYKATQSQGVGKFTAINDDNMLAFDDDKTATIVATYGDIEVSEVESDVDATGEIVPGLDGITKLVIKTDATDGSNATQSMTNYNEVLAPMYSVSSAAAEASYSSVGESANLYLIRPFPVLRFTTEGVDRYAEDFGPLKSVTLETKREDSSASTGWSAGSNIAYAADKSYTIIDNSGTTGWENSWEATTDPNKVTVEFTTSDNWSDDNAVYMTVAPVNRTSTGVKDMLVITYEFENISFVLDGTNDNAEDFEALETGNNWTSVSTAGRPNAITPLPALEISNYPYLVLGNTTTNIYTLIINNGSIADTMGSNGVIWPLNSTTEVDFSYFSKIIVNCEISDSDFANLNKFTNAEYIEMTEQTKIPSGGLNAFTSTTSGLTLKFPKVTEVADDFVSSEFTKLENLEMGSYGFEEGAINDMFFNSTTANTLKYIDISAVEDFGPVYNGRQAILFTDYTALESIKVKDGAELYSHQFDGCTNLTEVDGSVNLSANNATYAFDNVSQLETINVTETIVPDYAFNSASALENVLLDGMQLAPTSVGSNAFANATSLQYMDLSATTTIGASAFSNSGLTASAAGSDLKVGATTIGASAFASTSVVNVHFTDLTSVPDMLFYNVTTLRQIKFNKAFSATSLSDGTFGTDTSNVDLLVNEDQGNYNGSTLTLGGQSFVFYSIRVEEPYY